MIRDSLMTYYILAAAAPDQGTPRALLLLCLQWGCAAAVTYQVLQVF
jgi:hypothetical protein